MRLDILCKKKYRSPSLIYVGIATMLPLSTHAADGLTDLGILSGGLDSAAYAVSADGSVVVGFSADRAFRWTQAGGMLSLGDLNGGNFSTAFGVSADGSVVVGSADDGNAGFSSRAFRWTQAGGMVSLGDLNGGDFSTAVGVSADGSVVVGSADDGNAGFASRAFRWTQAGGMVSLGDLNGGDFSQALGVSADGIVVVGIAFDGSAGNASRAFRWTQAGGMISLGNLNGGNSSFGLGVSADGSTVVGLASDGSAGNASRAFRWTQTEGMANLGVLNGGDFSMGLGVSGDGNVVVGQATDGSDGNTNRAFRWTQTGGMQSVEQWLVANGVTVAPGLSTQSANATNADGSVVVGTLDNSHAFLARVSVVGSGIIDPADFNRTLYDSGYTHIQVNAQTDLVMHGLHGSPMSGLLSKGRYNLWVAGDWGRQDRATNDADHGSGEFGAAYAWTDDVMFKLALGRTYSQQDSLYGGETTLNGTYVMPELVVGIPNTALKFSASGYYNDGDAGIRRGYLNAGTPVISSGRPDADAKALRLRLDWLNAYQVGNLRLTPYVSFTWLHSHIGDYTETGGGFPVHWKSRNEHATQGRLGMDGTYALSDRVKLLGRIEGVHGTDGHSSNASGRVLGLSNFELPAMNYRQSWLRAGAGVEALAGPGTASVMVNGTTENYSSRYWIYASYRLTF